MNRFDEWLKKNFEKWYDANKERMTTTIFQAALRDAYYNGACDAMASVIGSVDSNGI